MVQITIPTTWFVCATAVSGPDEGRTVDSEIRRRNKGEHLEI